MTPKGVERLRSLSGLALSTVWDSARFNSQVGVVCALEDPELAAVLKALGRATAWKEIGDARHAHVYRETSMVTAGGQTLRIVAATSTSMGLTADAISTTQLILEFRPQLVAMIGIAAGTHSVGKQFGDALVADPSVHYNSGKVVLAGGIREFQPDSYPIGLTPRIRTLLQKYRSSHPVFAEIRRRWRCAVSPDSNRLHVGPVGAADQVIDNTTRVFEIQKNWRKLLFKCFRLLGSRISSARNSGWRRQSMAAT